MFICGNSATTLWPMRAGRVSFYPLLQRMKPVENSLARHTEM